METRFVLYIEDENMDSTWKTIENRAKVELGIDLEWESINPLDFLDLREGIDGLYQFLEANYLDSTIDLIACDYKYGDEERSTAFKIIDYIRSKNQVCPLFLYSGTLMEVVKYIYDVEKSEEKLSKSQKKTINRPLKTIAKSKIVDFIDRRVSTLQETVLNLIQKPTTELEIERYLLKFPEFVMEAGCSFAGEPYHTVAEEVRMLTPRAVQLIREITTKGLTHTNLLNFPK